MATNDQSVNYENFSSDVENYLINNYKDALNRGDKWAAKSYLLTARYFSLNDQDVTNEIYLMAKSDSDAHEASKCFAKIFNDLLSNNENDNSTSKINIDRLKQVRDQMKEETKFILNDLETKFLKLKSTYGTQSESPQSQSNNPTTSSSPIMGILASPKHRMRMISVESRDSISKIENSQLVPYQKSSTCTRKSFYHQLFDYLPEETKRNILYQSIESCDNNSIEACKLMMLTISIYNDVVTTYGSRLLRTLINLSNPNKIQQEGTDNNTTSHDICKYAKSLLVLDAIPLVLNMTSLKNLDVESEELFERTLNLYSDHYLEAAAKEYQVNELHEGMKKFLSARIIGIEHKPITEELREDYLIGTLKFLSQKFMDTLTDPNVRSKFDELRCLITDKVDMDGKFEKIHNIIQNLNLDVDLSDDVLFNSIKHESSSSSVGSQSQQVLTPPPKTRGRPKKNQSQQQQQQSVIVSLDDGVKRHLHNKSREIQFIFHLLIEYMFVNCARYLKNIKSRILFNYDDNYLLKQIDGEIWQLESRMSSATYKHLCKCKDPIPEGEDIDPIKLKRIKLMSKIDILLKLSSEFRESPINSEQAKKMDKLVISTLIQVQECLSFLLDPANGIFNKLWEHYIKTNHIENLNWYKRINVDCLLLTAKSDKVTEILVNELSNEPIITDDTVVTQTEQCDSQTCSVTTISSMSTGSTITRLRKIVMLISCYLQLSNKPKIFDKIEELLTIMKESGLLASDICPYENVLDDYMIQINYEKSKYLGFVLFDSISLVRYCVKILTSIHKRYAFKSYMIETCNDVIIGHAIVLSQFDWPKESRLYDFCISWIRANKPKSTTPQTLSATTKFTYPEFFSYIRNPNIIEDFMSLLNQGYTLDIKGPGTGNTGSGSQNSTGSSTRGNIGSSTRSSKMITTRGVNKTFKEDLKVALISQMKNSSIVLPLELIVEFLQEALIPYFKSQ